MSHYATSHSPQCDFRSKHTLVAMKLRIFPADGLDAVLVPIFNRINYPLFFGGRVFLVVQTQYLSRADHLCWFVDGAIPRIGRLEWSSHVVTPKPVQRLYRKNTGLIS